MHDQDAWNKVEADIKSQRSVNESSEAWHMVANVGVLLALLSLFYFFWAQWGQSGFTGPYRHIAAYAEAEAGDARARAEAQAALSKPTKLAQKASSAPVEAPPLPPALKAPSAAEIAAAIGQSGDAYGGANALFSSLVAAFAAWAGYLQFRALQRAQRAYQDQIDETKREKFARRNEGKERKAAQFESHFFQLLELTRDARERISASKTNPNREPKTGSAALDAFANTIYKEVFDAANKPPYIPITARQLTFHYQAIYRRRPSALGPYLRLLFQTFKFISGSDVDPTVKLQCAKIARGQMSDGSVLLLALNGMTVEGCAFVEYIEEFGLLEHMLDKYRNELMPHLLAAYRPRAFMGSAERAMPESAHQTKIGCSPEKFHWTESELAEREGLHPHLYTVVGNDAE